MERWFGWTLTLFLHPPQLRVVVAGNFRAGDPVPGVGRTGRRIAAVMPIVCACGATRWAVRVASASGQDGQKQAIAFMLSDMQVETDALRWLIWKAASQLEQGGVDATRASVFAWSTAAEQVMKIADNGVQVLGGHGFIREHPVEMWYRHARTLSVLEGVVGI